MSNLFNLGVVRAAQGGGVQDGQREDGLGVVHDRGGALQDNARGRDGLGGYQRGGQDEGQLDGLHRTRVVGGQGGNGEALTRKMDCKKHTPSGKLNPGSRRKATPKRKVKEIEPGLVQEKITSFLRLFPNLNGKGATFRMKSNDLKSTPSLKRKDSLDPEGISPAKRRCKD